MSPASSTLKTREVVRRSQSLLPRVVDRWPRRHGGISDARNRADTVDRRTPEAHRRREGAAPFRARLENGIRCKCLRVRLHEKKAANQETEPTSRTSDNTSCDTIRTRRTHVRPRPPENVAPNRATRR